MGNEEDIQILEFFQIINLHLVLAWFYIKFNFQPSSKSKEKVIEKFQNYLWKYGGKSGVPISTDTIYNKLPKDSEYVRILDHSEGKDGKT